MLVVILRRHRVVVRRDDIFATAFATVNARIGRQLPRMRNRIKRRMVVLVKVGRVLVIGHCVRLLCRFHRNRLDKRLQRHRVP